MVDPVYAPTVLASAPEIRTFATLVAGRENTNAQVVGVTPVYLTARNLDLASGMFIKSPHVDNRDEVSYSAPTWPSSYSRTAIPSGSTFA